MSEPAPVSGIAPPYRGLPIRLQELVAGLPLEHLSGLSTEVTGVHHDSRQIQPGDLFVAIRGTRYDGRHFAREAVERGAAAILSGGPPLEPPPVPWLTSADPRSLLGPLSARVFRHPDREMTLVGVTGTNGKSTCVWLMQSVMEAAGIPTGNLGTVHTSFRDIPLATARTTPEAPELFQLLRQLRDRGAAGAAMEVSSHSLVLGRVSEVRFRVAVFTHLSRDHLDFHGDMESYFRAKCRLFRQLRGDGVAVVGLRDSWGTRLASELPRVITFGEGGDVHARQLDLQLGGTRAVIATPRGELEVESRLIGSYNLENILAVVAAAEALGIPHQATRAGIAHLQAVPGRMESVDAGQPFPVFIDYAHTDDALRRLYGTVRKLTGRRLIGVFGLQGERDPGKRPLMGRVAGGLADLVILTTDNPRSEDPVAIMEAIAEGVREGGRAEVRLIPDRAEAIREAMRAAIAGPDAAVLVTGKGNETGQEIAGQTLPYSDRESIEAALAELGSAVTTAQP
jgi:UDP-N-acetylmuramoyl-L-alanyl-D-glutamate--2,6-diaminopimelate ligase